jgi:hypothetical protein
MGLAAAATFVFLLPFYWKTKSTLVCEKNLKLGQSKSSNSL